MLCWVLGQVRFRGGEWEVCAGRPMRIVADAMANEAAVRKFGESCALLRKALGKTNAAEKETGTRTL